ncbi:transketolase family protein [Mogibacterium timidum]|uniref:Transketolase family protein n=1 Tax=Mogibacterium timidum TaxID=35519 RepID=A0A7Y9B0Q0_9FIRM|nr:transketolase family protein [Mogibacterium timidum]NWO23107.1 transketolase family protein [Mogibacterium timidum]
MADKIATRAAYGEFLVEKGAARSDLVVMDADLSGSTKTKGFAQAYPERFINCGIAEQDLMAEAAGIALSGHVVCASTFAMFATGRAYEIIRNSIGYTHANVKVCATHAGITVGEDGASHQTFEDIALMREIPGMTVVNPADAVSARKLLDEVVDTDGPAYVRLGRSGVPVIYGDDADIKVGKANTVREGTDVTIIATGIMVADALEAADELAAKGVSARVIDMHTIKPIDSDAIIKAAADTGKIVTAEEHSVIGGLGSAVAEVLVQNEPVKVAMVGQKDTFGESGKPDELRAKYGLTKADIINAVTNTLE